AEAVSRSRRIFGRLCLDACRRRERNLRRDEQLGLWSVRVHVVPVDHLEAHLDDASLPCCDHLRLSVVDHIRLGAGGAGVHPAYLRHQRSCAQQKSGEDYEPAHYSPPFTAVVVPEAIVFLMLASISSLELKPAVASTMVPFLST